MFAVERVVDLAFLIVILQFGKVDHPVFAGILGLAVDLKHDFIGLERHR